MIVTELKRVALVNDYELVVRGLAAMLDPFRDRVRVVELDVGTNPEHSVDVALFDTYGHPHNGVDRVHRSRPIAAWVPWLSTRGRSRMKSATPSSPPAHAACSRSPSPPSHSCTRCSRLMPGSWL